MISANYKKLPYARHLIPVDVLGGPLPPHSWSSIMEMGRPSFRWLWWLLLWVSLTGLRKTQIAGKHYFWVFLWGVSGRDEYLVQWAEWRDLPYPLGHHPVRWNKKMKEAQTLSLFKLRHPSPPALIVPGSWTFQLQDLHRWLPHCTLSIYATFICQ